MHQTATAQVMGTVASIDVHDDAGEEAVSNATASAFERLRDIDSIFSTYKTDSEITRLGRGDISLEDCSNEVHVVLGLCETMRNASNGAFDIYAAARTGPANELQSITSRSRPLEPSGMVKGWAIDEAVGVLRSAGLSNFVVNIGGDVFASGWTKNDKPWRIGLQHPTQRLKVMGVVVGANFAVATSGTYERGEHIATTSQDEFLQSITIVGPDITLADAYATAAFAMGKAGMEWAAALSEFEVFAVGAGGTTHRSPGMDRYLVTPL